MCRHNLRVAQSYVNAVRSSNHLEKRLYVSIAADEFKSKLEPGELEVAKKALLRQTNLREAQYLSCSLPLYVKGRYLL